MDNDVFKNDKMYCDMGFSCIKILFEEPEKWDGV